MKKLFLATCAVLALQGARATTVIPPTFGQLVDQAEVIVEGTVKDVRSQFVGEGGQRHIVTYVTVEVNDALKGAPGATYTFRMLGGTVGDHTMEVSDAPRFTVGDREILFTENNGTQFIPLVGIMHGRFQLQKDDLTGADVVLEHSGKALTNLHHLGQTDENRAPAATNAVERPLDVDAFKAAIRQKLGGVR